MPFRGLTHAHSVRMVGDMAKDDEPANEMGSIFCRSIGPGGTTVKFYATPRGVECVEDCEGLVARRFDAQPGTCYLLRPDQHVCGRWRQFDADLIRGAVARATCNEPSQG